MIVGTPSNVTFVAPSNQVQVNTIILDMLGHTITFVYGPPNGAPSQGKSTTVPMPAAIQTAVENEVQRMIENAEGFAANSTTVVTP
jgi:hypothetical protein